MSDDDNWILPYWPAPAGVCARVSTRAGGVSVSPYDSLNLGGHVGDDPQAVAANRAKVRAVLPAEPVWLEQVHGVTVVQAEAVRGRVCADAALTRTPGVVCVVMTADCLPVLFCDEAGRVVAAAHAGWRGLLAGVLENTLVSMQVPPAGVLAWLGPAIGPRAFEVGQEVFEAFARAAPEDACGFQPAGPGKWWSDLYTLARQRLARAGVLRVYGGDFCTASDPPRFFSYRRDGATGRMGSFIWLAR